MRTILSKCLSILLSGVAMACLGQQAPNSLSVDQLLEDLAQGKDAEHAIGSLSRHGDDQRTVPALRSAFLNSTEKKIKQSVAIAMFSLNEQDPIYFDYLAHFAMEAVESDAPSVFPTSDSGEIRYRDDNPEFAKWCRANGKDATDEAAKQLREYPLDLMFLASVHDVRSTAIFKKGLNSNNVLLVRQCAFAIASFKDPRDIEVLISAAENHRPNMDTSIARALAESYLNPSERSLIDRQIRGTKLHQKYLNEVVLVDRINAAGEKR